MTCRCCQARGTGYVGALINYARMPSGHGQCPRCEGTEVDPGSRKLHVGLVLENVRSGVRWVINADYGEEWEDRGGRWSMHRFKPARHGGHYVWQIRHFTVASLMDPKRWREVGFGDAWDHDLMRSPSL